MQTIERELPWVQPRPSVKDHLFIGGLKHLFPARALAGTRGSRQRAAEQKQKAEVLLNNSHVTPDVVLLTETSRLQSPIRQEPGKCRKKIIQQAAH